MTIEPQLTEADRQARKFIRLSNEYWLSSEAADKEPTNNTLKSRRTRAKNAVEEYMFAHGGATTQVELANMYLEAASLNHGALQRAIHITSRLCNVLFKEGAIDAVRKLNPKADLADALQYALENVDAILASQNKSA